MPAIFYPPPMPQFLIPRTPIPDAAPAPDNPTGGISKLPLILLSWIPYFPSRINLERAKVPLIPGDTTGDNPPVNREKERIQILVSNIWSIPIPLPAKRGNIANLLPIVDDPPYKLQEYAKQIYNKWTDLTWPLYPYIKQNRNLYTPGIPIPIPNTTFQLNVNVLGIRNPIEIAINNNRRVQRINQGSTFTFDMTAQVRYGFPRIVVPPTSISISIKDSLGNLVVNNATASFISGFKFVYNYQLASNAPLGPWLVSTTSNYLSFIKITPYQTIFIVE